MADETDMHARSVKAVAAAVAKLYLRFGPEGMTPEAIFEGAIKGSATAMMALRALSLGEVAELLERMAASIRHAGRTEVPANDEGVAEPH
jgi:hypothetical protein